MQPKKIILANDLPGIGKVALATAIPIFSCCQIETYLLPTVLLSSHTGGFPHIAIQESTEFLQNTLQQWQSLQLTSDAMFIGYCRHQQQLQQLLDYHQQQTQQQLFVDPIMGDNGKLYSGFSHEYVAKMRTVCSQATVVMPNLTEAALLTDTDYYTEPQPLEYYQVLAKKVASLGSKIVILTGIQLSVHEHVMIGALAYDSQTQRYFHAVTPKYPQHFFGTGDMFSAIITAALLQEIPLEEALQMALTFTDSSIQTTLQSGRDLRFGLIYEPHLQNLMQLFQEKETYDEINKLT